MTRTMRLTGLFTSPRRRRRLAWTAAFVAVMAVGAWGTYALQKAAESEEPLPVVSAPEQDAVPETPVAKPIVVTPAVRREVGATVDAFVRTAVVRRDLDAAWKLASPEMKAGVTRSQWNRGDLPVFPYPASKLKAASWRLTYVDGQTVGIDVTVFPKPRSGGLRLVYAARLTPTRAGRERRWLVDSWYPNVTLGSEEAAGNNTGRKGANGDDEAARTYGRARLGGAWLLVPVALFSLILLIPAVIALRGVRARRRAERLYRAGAR